jgi:N-acetylglucosamine kinase-like BadF-type ATPase
MTDGLLAGVDGGASKTRAVILAAGGETLGSATVESASAYHREPEEAAGVVAAALRDALRQAGRTAPVAALGAGLAGADDPAIHDRLMRALGASGLASFVHVDHDAAAALAGGLALEPGVVIIAGTGSVAFGIDASGRRARADGWGPLLGDDGSGYAIGRAVLRAAMRHFDGRGPATALADAVGARFGLASLASLKTAVRGISIDQTAGVAPLALSAARSGDAVALGIVHDAAGGLAEAIAAVARALDWTRTAVPVVTAGGVFKAGEAIIVPMLAALAALGCSVAHRQATFTPEIGAALLAARAGGFDARALIARLADESNSTR